MYDYSCLYTYSFDAIVASCKLSNDDCELCHNLNEPAVFLSFVCVCAEVYSTNDFASWSGCSDFDLLSWISSEGMLIWLL